MIKRRDFILVGLGGLVGGLSTRILSSSPVILPDNSKQLSIDVGYAQSMVVHHQQAIMMSSLLASNGAGPVANLALRIMDAQKAEIAQMTGWLAGLGEPVLPTSGDLMGWMKQADHLLNINERLYLERCKNSPSGMAGLISQEEVRKLQLAQHQDKEQLFLHNMIKHHEGALGMSTLPSRHGQTQFIRYLASHVLQSQSNEITLMTKLLAS